MKGIRQVCYVMKKGAHALKGMSKARGKKEMLQLSRGVSKIKTIHFLSTKVNSEESYFLF